MSILYTLKSLEKRESGWVHYVCSLGLKMGTWEVAPFCFSSSVCHYVWDFLKEQMNTFRRDVCLNL